MTMNHNHYHSFEPEQRIHWYLFNNEGAVAGVALIVDEWEVNSLREVDVEEVEVQCGLHQTSSDSNGVNHVLREVSVQDER